MAAVQPIPGENSRTQTAKSRQTGETPARQQAAAQPAAGQPAAGQPIPQDPAAHIPPAAEAVDPQAVTISQQTIAPEQPAHAGESVNTAMTLDVVPNRA